MNVIATGGNTAYSEKDDESFNTPQREIALQEAAAMGIPDQIIEIVFSQFYGAP